MARRVFFSFHYKLDNWRASQIRNIGVIEGNTPVNDNDWETIAKGGNIAIKRWIDQQMHGRSCAIVLIGNKTAQRKWIKYEIEKAWKNGKGVVGIYIHNLKDKNGKQTAKGKNPFHDIRINGLKLSNIVKAYDPSTKGNRNVEDYIESFFNWLRGRKSRQERSKHVYSDIKAHIEDWVEEAISIRNEF